MTHRQRRRDLRLLKLWAQCKDHRFVCEVHPWLPFPHDACAGPGLPCPECQSPSAKPELPDGWESYASTGDDPFDPQPWPPFAPKPQSTRKTLFTFERRGRTITCELRYSEYGVEAVFLEDGDLFQSHQFNTKTLAIMWAEGKRAAIERGHA